MEQKRIYLDNAATTRTDPEVVKVMEPYFTEVYAVASSQFSHMPGILARESLDNTREIVAKRINASPDELIFTSGGTEANNLAVKGTAWAFRGEKDHVICSKIEHNTVLHSCQWLEEEGFRLTLLDVDSEGFVDLNQLQESISDQTFLVSIQHGNQEVGTVQPIEEIGRICTDKGVLFHVDAALSFTQLDLDVDQIHADLVTLSAHKIHGPKGVGALYIRKGTRIKKMVHGGYSEFDLRSGTENVAGVVGFGQAVKLAQHHHVPYIRGLQKALFDGLKKEIDGIEINGPQSLSKRLPGNVNVSFHSVEGESVVLHLDMKGISVITGSACFSRSLEPSYVMMAMRFPHERAHGSIRFTLSRYNQMEEIDYVVNSCKEIVNALRKISPLKT
ncbi:cysteine desulfurase [bacterium]|nr:cysteine desulfurase [bacterium]